jgi:hypothetical protein
MLVATGQPLPEDALERGVAEDQMQNPSVRDGQIQQDGVRPNYGSKRKAL